MFNPTELIQNGGVLLVGLIIFAESGMLVGFFFPGDTLLLTGGILAAQGKLSLLFLLITVIIAAIAGDNTGYQIGFSLGRRLFAKGDGIFFRKRYVEESEKFYERYGSKTMMLAHFIPIIRTFAPIVAGAGKMHRVRFVIFDAIGDTAWAIIVTLLGYWFGSRIPNIDHYILPTVATVVILSFGPVIYHVVRALLARKGKLPPED
ncbi:MAG TPA: VTT domain-containing protein [Candidatus Saccharimonadales bacterium]|jgi:membrane-associated protein|nr:VTT domain-containing protein [Candidatus Saccharimonadales bacterium]